MTATQFYSTCVAIWGDGWVRGGMQCFKVNERTLRGWAHGRDEIPPGIVDEISAAALEKIARLTELTQ